MGDNLYVKVRETNKGEKKTGEILLRKKVRKSKGIGPALYAQGKGLKENPGPSKKEKIELELIEVKGGQ